MHFKLVRNAGEGIANTRNSAIDHTSSAAIRSKSDERFISSVAKRLFEKSNLLLASAIGNRGYTGKTLNFVLVHGAGREFV
jgi:hypothetical protein